MITIGLLSLIAVIALTLVPVLNVLVGFVGGLMIWGIEGAVVGTLIGLRLTRASWRSLRWAVSGGWK